MKRTSKWSSLKGDLTEEASKIRSGLNGRHVLVRRSVKVVDGKIVITHVGTWPMLSAFRSS